LRETKAGKKKNKKKLREQKKTGKATPIAMTWSGFFK